MAHLMVLAAGLGSRLRPLTDELPKPLVPVGDSPLLEHILRRAEVAGFDRAVINAHWGATALREFVATSTRPLTLVEEPELLGTAGGVANAARALSAPVLIWNGDIWANLERQHWRAAVSRREPTLFVASEQWQVPVAQQTAPGALAGSVGIDASNRVVRLRGELFGKEERAADYIGLMVLPEVALQVLPERGCLVGDFLLPWLRGGRQVHVEFVEQPWSDLGSKESYLEMNLTWLSERNLARFVGPGCSVSDAASIEQSVIGAGAVVLGSGAVTESVVWPGATVSAPLHRSVVTRGGHIVVCGPVR